MGELHKLETCCTYRYRFLLRSYFQIHSSGEVTDFGVESIHVDGGTKWTVAVTPSKVGADDSLAKLSFAERKCLMPTETRGAQLFRTYTQTNCLAEFKLHSAMEELGCIPWFMPYIEHFKRGNQTRICSKYESFHYLTKINQENLLINEDEESYCKEPCETFSYEHTMYRASLHPVTECSQMRQSMKEAELTSRYIFPHASVMLLDDKFQLRPDDMREVYKRSTCSLMMRGTSILTIKPSKLRVNVIHQRKRISFTSQLATFGRGKRFLSLISFLSLRWSGRPLYWHQPFEHH